MHDCLTCVYSSMEVCTCNQLIENAWQTKCINENWIRLCEKPDFPRSLKHAYNCSFAVTQRYTCTPLQTTGKFLRRGAENIKCRGFRTGSNAVESKSLWGWVYACTHALMVNVVSLFSILVHIHLNSLSSWIGHWWMPLHCMHVCFWLRECMYFPMVYRSNLWQGTKNHGPWCWVCQASRTSGRVEVSR